MAKSNPRRRRSRRRERTRRAAGMRAARSPVLCALTSSTLALPGIAGTASADAPPLGVTADYSYAHYSEDDIKSGKLQPGSSGERYEIDIHQLRFVTPVGDRFDLGLDLAYETMTGATPWYVARGPSDEPLQVMTGATIEEQRTDALVSGNYYLDNGKAGASAGLSIENDYLAFNGGLSGERHFREKTTTLSGGIGLSIDQIEPVDTDLFPLRPDKEDKQSYSVFAGISQVINRSSQIQSTASFQHSAGFLSDPYKEVVIDTAGSRIADSRPDARNQFSWLTRYRQRLSDVDGTLHVDYRFYVDDWGINSHTIEMAWYQSLFDAIRLIPSVRYYSQNQADFYAPFFDGLPSNGLASSDYRLSPYGALSWRVKAETRFQTWNIDWTANIGWERYVSSGDLALGKVKVENPGLVSFNLLSIGLQARF